MNPINIELELLNEQNRLEVLKIQRDDISEDYVDSVAYIIETTDYGKEHNYIGHTYAIKYLGKYIGIILMGEAIEWSTDPNELKGKPFYRIMGFIIDHRYRSLGIGSYVLDQVISRIFKEYGARPIALGCQKDNIRAIKFYEKHGFIKNAAMDDDDYYFIKYPE